jgi:hypothetical protein
VKVLEYTGLDTSRVKASYRKVADAIARNDFRAAQVKKLVQSQPRQVLPAPGSTTPAGTADRRRQRRQRQDRADP